MSEGHVNCVEETATPGIVIIRGPEGMLSSAGKVLPYTSGEGFTVFQALQVLGLKFEDWRRSQLGKLVVLSGPVFKKDGDSLYWECVALRVASPDDTYGHTKATHQAFRRYSGEHEYDRREDGERDVLCFCGSSIDNIDSWWEKRS